MSRHLAAAACLVVAAGACLTFAAACGPAEHPSPTPGASASAAAPSPNGTSTSAASASSSAAASSSGTGAAPEAPVVSRPPALSIDEAMDLCFPVGRSPEAMECARLAAAISVKVPLSEDEQQATIRCILMARYMDDPPARELALDLYRKLGSVTGVIREHDMDGGWRGELHLVPELPVGKYRKHLGWLKQSFEDIDAFFTELADRRAPDSKARYRHRALGFRFFRSVGRTTPSAYAQGWEIAYNVSGSLHSGLDAVRETLFHETFHLNDAAHGAWSARVLSPIVDGITATCGQKTACLTPYAPGTTMVRGGTYYAFQKGNGVHEYAAELATRYFTEHRTVLEGKKLAKPPFKCGPPENWKAWTAMVGEFFGVDLTPACAR